VRLLDDRLGTIKFIGVLNNHALQNMKRPCVSYGIELDKPFQEGNNGSLDGIKYFNAEDKCGFFVSRDQIKENVRAQFRPGERLKKWNSKLYPAERHVERDVNKSSPASIQSSVDSPSVVVKQKQSRPEKVVDKSEPIDRSYDDSPVLTNEAINISVPAEQVSFKTSKVDEALSLSVDPLGVSQLNNPCLNRSKHAEVYVESEQQSGLNSASHWQSKLSVLPGQNIQPGPVSLERPSKLVALNIQPTDRNLERPSAMVVHSFPSNDTSQTEHEDLFTIDSKLVKEEEKPLYNQQVSLTLSEASEVPNITIHGDMSMLNDQDSVGESDSTEMFDIQSNHSSLNIAPSPVKRSESAPVVVHNIEPDKLTHSEKEIFLDRSKPTEVFVEDVDITPSKNDQNHQLSVKPNISPSLISINIIPTETNDDNIFDQGALSAALPIALSVGAEEDGKVEEKEIPSNEAVYERMLKLLGEGFGSNVDENIIKEKVSNLLRNLGKSTNNSTSDKNNPQSDDDVSECSDMEGNGVDNGLEIPIDESSVSTDVGDLNTNTVRFDPFGQEQEDEESEEGIFSGTTQYDENLLENMGMVKFEKMHYSTLRHHSHKLSQNYGNLPSFSSVIKENTRKRGSGFTSPHMGTERSDGFPTSRRIASEPVINLPIESYMDVKSPELEDGLNEDEEKVSKNTEESHDIDNKAKRLDDIDEQMKVIGEELTELTNKSFQVLLEMGQADDAKSQTLEKEYLKIEVKSQELRQKKSSLDMERQDLVDSVQKMMFASFDIMAPSDNPLSGLSGFDMGFMSTNEDTEMFTSPHV